MSLPIEVIADWLAGRRDEDPTADDTTEAMELIELLETRGWSLDAVDVLEHVGSVRATKGTFVPEPADLHYAGPVYRLRIRGQS